jgi:hypothetical protein
MPTAVLCHNVLVFWLWVAHFGQGESKDNACLTIVVEGPELRFGCRYNNEP